VPADCLSITSGDSSDSDSAGGSEGGSPSDVAGALNSHTSWWQSRWVAMQQRRAAWQQKTQQYRAVGTQRRLARLWRHLSRTKQANSSAEARTGVRLLRRLGAGGGVAGTAATGGGGSTLGLGPVSVDPAPMLSVGEVSSLAPAGCVSGVEPLSGALGSLFGGGFI
jgi:hypothetical protein